MVCFICKAKCEDDNALMKHLEEEHQDYLKDNNFTPRQAYYHVKNRFKLKRIGVCGCGSRKEWNEEKDKYEYYCGSDECKTKMNQIYVNNMQNKHKVASAAELIDVQYKMMEARGSSMFVLSATDYIIVRGSDMDDDPELATKIQEYIDKGASKFVYLSKVEEKTILELIGMFDHKDLRAPHDVHIEYTFPGEDKVRKHIPDIFVKSLNLIISCKDSILHPNRHEGMVQDRFKNLFEYQAILNSSDCNYFQIEGEDDIPNLPKYIGTVKKMHATKSRYVSPPKVDVFVLISEGLESSTDREFNDDMLSMCVLESVLIGSAGVTFKLSESERSIRVNPETKSISTVIVEEGLLLDMNKVTSMILESEQSIHSFDLDLLITIQEGLSKVFSNSTFEDIESIVAGVIINDSQAQSDIE